MQRGCKEVRQRNGYKVENDVLLFLMVTCKAKLRFPCSPWCIKDAEIALVNAYSNVALVRCYMPA